MWRSTVVAVVTAGAAVVPAAAVAQPVAAPGDAVTATSAAYGAERYLFMVRDVEFAGGIYTGQFSVMRKSGRWVTGAHGMFYSEARCLTGRVRGYPPKRWLIGRLPGYWYGDTWIPMVRLTAKWVGYGDQQRMRGWTSVTPDEMYELSGGGIDGSIIDSVCTGG